MFKLAIVGFGAIGQELARVLHGTPDLEVTQILVTHRSKDRLTPVAAKLVPCARVLTDLDSAAGDRPELLAECAGHAAIVSHVIPALRAGIPCVIASVGALADGDRFA